LFSSLVADSRNNGLGWNMSLPITGSNIRACTKTSVDSLT
jgi:hypothetical protein